MTTYLNPPMVLALVKGTSVFNYMVILLVLALEVSIVHSTGWFSYKQTNFWL